MRPNCHDGFPHKRDEIKNMNHMHCECCSHMNRPIPQPPPPMHKSSGWIEENIFTIVNNIPCLVDHTCIKYGPFTSVSENVVTKVAQRHEDSCVTLSATFDMTQSINTNVTLLHFLTQLINNQYKTLNKVLPIIKSIIKFKLFYTITDELGAVVFNGDITSNCQEMNLHVTDVRDYFVTSCNNLFATNLPDYAYTGMHTITIDRIEAYVSKIDTLIHLEEPEYLNPYYQFTKTNTKVVVQHERILKQLPDEENICIGTCNVNRSFNYHSNVTTKFKCSFRAYLSDFSVCHNTFNIWSTLNEPSTTEMLEKDIEELKTTIDELNQTINDMKSYEETLLNRISRLEEFIGINDEDAEKPVTPTVLNDVICYSVFDISESSKYKQNTEYKIGQTVWLNPGDPYIVNGDFISDNTEGYSIEQSFKSDITNNNITAMIN